MAGKLEITDVRVGAPRAAKFRPADQRLDISVDVRNNSRSTLHVITSVRSLDYDSATQTLFVGLSEPELKGDIKPSNFVPPHTKAIPPKKSETIEVSVPVTIHKILPSPAKLGLSVETLDVSSLRHIRCALSFSATPFYPKRSNSPENMSKDLRSWGETAETTVQRSDSGDAPKPPRRPRKPGP